MSRTAAARAEVERIRAWHAALARRFDPAVRGYVIDVAILLRELGDRDAQIAAIERAPTEPQPALGATPTMFWNTALAQAELAIATEFGRSKVAARNLYDTERTVQAAVRALRRGVQL